MTIRRLRPYLVNLGIVIYTFIYPHFYGVIMSDEIKRLSSLSHSSSLSHVTIYNILGFVIFGILFGLNPFLDHVKLKDKLYIKWKQIIFFGLPLFIYILCRLIPNRFIMNYETKLFGDAIIYKNALDFLYILFGFVIIMSIKNKECLQTPEVIITRLRPYLVNLGIVIYIFLYQDFYGVISVIALSGIPISIYILLGAIMLGILLGLNPFLDHIELKGKLYVKWKQILPFFIYFLFLFLAFIFRNSFMSSFILTKLFGNIYLFGEASEYLGILFGFLIITSIKNKECLLRSEDL